MNNNRNLILERANKEVGTLLLDGWQVTNVSARGAIIFVSLRLRGKSMLVKIMPHKYTISTKDGIRKSETL